MLAELREAARAAASRPGLRLILALLTAESVVVGGLDLLFVVLAVTVLGRPQAWAGYLNSADGAGPCSLRRSAPRWSGRRLGVPVLAAALALSAALGALAFGVGAAGTIVLLTLVGASRALLEVASRSLLQRSVPVQLIGRIFGLLEGLTMAGLAAGALLVPALAGLGGTAARPDRRRRRTAACRGRRGKAPVRPRRGCARAGGRDRAAARTAAVRRAACARRSRDSRPP